MFAGTITVERDADGIVLASFTMPPEPTDETVYVLRVPLDSVGPPGSRARPGDPVSFFIQRDTDGDGVTDTSEISGVGIVGERGEAQSLDLDTTFDPARPRIMIEDAQRFEGDSGGEHLVFTVHVDPVVDRELSLDYQTADGSATAVGQDYVATSDRLTVPPGEAVATIEIEVRGDEARAEGDEHFFVDLTADESQDLSLERARAKGRDPRRRRSATAIDQRRDRPRG